MRVRFSPTVLSEPEIYQSPSGRLWQRVLAGAISLSQKSDISKFNEPAVQMHNARLEEAVAAGVTDLAKRRAAVLHRRQVRELGRVFSVSHGPRLNFTHVEAGGAALQVINPDLVPSYANLLMQAFTRGDFKKLKELSALRVLVNRSAITGRGTIVTLGSLVSSQLQDPAL